MKNIGIILDSLLVSKQINDLLILLNDKKHNYDIYIILNTTSKFKTKFPINVVEYILKRGFLTFARNLLFNLLENIEKLLLLFNPKYRKLLKSYKISVPEEKIIKVNPIYSKTGLSYNYRETDINLLKKANIDLLIRGGNGIIKGSILDEIKYGIISFHHGDNNVYRGGPPGFWEVYNRDDYTGFIIQLLNNELDGGLVLAKGFINTSYMYMLNKLRIFEYANHHMVISIDRLTSDEDMHVIESKPYFGPLYTTPKFHQLIKYCLKLASVLLKKLWRRYIRGGYKWQINYKFTNSLSNAVFHKSTSIKNPKNRYLADPVPYEHKGNNYIFCEDFDIKASIGKISVYLITKDSYKRIGTAISENFHLSFPFIFEYDGRIFMCPETSSSRKICLYECLEFPLKWKFHSVLKDNISAADTIIFKYDDKWWMFTNVDETIFSEHCHVLQIYYSISPLNSDWKLAHYNPVYKNSKHARNGGFFEFADQCYRVNQRHGFDLYGKGITLNKIINLDKSSYSESVVFESPDNLLDKSVGIHTLFYKKGLLTFDTCKS